MGCGGAVENPTVGTMVDFRHRRNHCVGLIRMTEGKAATEVAGRSQGRQDSALSEGMMAWPPSPLWSVSGTAGIVAPAFARHSRNCHTGLRTAGGEAATASRRKLIGKTRLYITGGNDGATVVATAERSVWYKKKGAVLKGHTLRTCKTQLSAHSVQELTTLALTAADNTRRHSRLRNPSDTELPRRALDINSGLASSVVVWRLFRNASLVRYPRFFVSQARVFVVLGVCPSTVWYRRACYGVPCYGTGLLVVSVLVPCGNRALDINSGLASRWATRAFFFPHLLPSSSLTCTLVPLDYFRRSTGARGKAVMRAAVADQAGNDGLEGGIRGKLLGIQCKSSVVVRRLFRNASLVRYPGFFVSQARVFVVLGVCPSTVWFRRVGPFVRDCETERLFLCCVVRVGYWPDQPVVRFRVVASFLSDSSFATCHGSSDDTDLDGTTQVPGQSPEVTAWLTKNLGHPTGGVTTVGGNIDCRLWKIDGKGYGRLYPS
ncbi:hypothetical protein Taro_010560 [Colocasia esculenta]|uniref:Uncharacterized protein n=1 Tax=Colocasia esculenta TaxID=4460 RepID=A0A843UDD5_COLES|nr:hypothetical protein [Colocasia esculenta]